MEFSRLKNFFVVLLTSAVLTAGVYFIAEDVQISDLMPQVESSGGQTIQENVLVENNNFQNESEKLPEEILPPQKLVNPPQIIKAVYVTGYSAGAKSYLNYLTNLFQTTEINAVVIDIKGSSGYISYNCDVEDAKKYKLNTNLISDIDFLVKFLHDKNIYVIGRIAVFEDPLYSKARPDIAIYNKVPTVNPSRILDGEAIGKKTLWRDNSGLSWLDPASKDAWDYNISIAKDALKKHGFDEINFDYIRFPSDGNMQNLGFPVWDEKIEKHEVIKEFFKYLREELEGEKISVDLFGQTTVNKDDMGIGQVIEDAFEYFDYISPMVYPSHYINGFIGFKNPAEHPYQVVKYSMENAVKRKAFYFDAQKNIFAKNSETSGSPAASSQLALDYSYLAPLAKFRPWLQDFDMGADYNAFMVKEEIRATQDALGEDFNGYMLWNPSNIYTKDAILKPN
jgi:hypothetical protein